MENTANRICRCLAMLLVRHGVRQAVVSPGSRNAPLLIALSRTPEITVYNIVDERSAAFVALGMAAISGDPVALVCTSGTAPLNYAPAVGEAYYRKLPLIVISADRPKEWIDQDDSQTIMQPGVYANFIKRCYDIDAGQTDSDLWYANRVINDALLAAISDRKAPVHLNIRLREPLGTLSESASDSSDPLLNRAIDMVKPLGTIPTSQARELGRSIASPCKILIIAGFMPPDKTLNKALMRLSRSPNIVVMTETISNLRGEYFVDSIDATLSSIKPEKLDSMRPDVVISTGGALVSRHVKQFLRSSRLRQHWHVGITDNAVDCFCQLTTRIDMDPSDFFPQLASAMQPHVSECDYALNWEVARRRALSLTTSYAQRAPWSDLKAFSVLIPMIPRRWNVQYSNGTSIRYAQIFGHHEYHRCDCNRGVSGIDGCTSTAIGASLAYKGDVTLFVSGDMSAQYDLSALTCRYISPRFKMIVINNHGGGIFRFIGSTSALDIREEMFCCDSGLDFIGVARACGFRTFEASDEASLHMVFKTFADEAEKPALLVINTPADSSEVLKNYFEFCKTQ